MANLLDGRNAAGRAPITAKANSPNVRCVAAPDTARGTTATGTSFIRPHLLKLAAYTPIEPFEILSAKLGRKPQDIVKLDANENPYGPPPEVLEALGSMQFANIYPDPETRRLRQALAQSEDVPVENLLVSGSCQWKGVLHAHSAVGALRLTLRAAPPAAGWVWR